MSERLSLETSDGQILEARIDSAYTPRLFTVFCHPHPLQGGSMNAPLMISVTRRLVERGHAVLRFNFRGVGSSTGTHDSGVAEQLDVAAAVDLALSRGLPVGVTGWSFGAAMALRWLADTGSEAPYAGIAPPPQLLPEEVGNGPKRIIVGTRDQLIDGDALRRYSAEKGIDLVLTPGDHFFHGRGAKIGDLVGQALEV